MRFLIVFSLVSILGCNDILFPRNPESSLNKRKDEKLSFSTDRRETLRSTKKPHEYLENCNDGNFCSKSDKEAEENRQRDIKAAKCWTEYKPYGDFSGDYTLHAEDIDCRQRLQECEVPCDMKYKKCDRDFQFVKDQQDCYIREKISDCYKKCKEQFNCSERVQKALDDCYKQKDVIWE